MDNVRKLLGLKKKEHPKSSGVTLNELKDTEEMLTKKVAFIESQIDEQTQLAKKFGIGNRNAAKRALKKRAILRKTLDQTEGMLMLRNIETQADALSGVKINQSVIDAMKNGVGALKAANESMDVEKVHDIMDSVVEQQDLSQEISDALNQSFSSGASDVDDEDLNLELEALEQEELDKALLTVTVQDSKSKGKNTDVNTNPTVSSDEMGAAGGTDAGGRKKLAPPKSREEEEDEAGFRELREWSLN